jgi:Na+(H+)/acetate symporter ActP
VYAALGRIYAPHLAVPGRSDALVLELPSIMVGGALGELLTAVVTAGAFAAFLSTSSGLCIAVAGVLSQDVTGRAWWSGRRLGGVAAFRLGALVAVTVPGALALLVPSIGVARAVGLAFAMAAATFCPLLLLGIWWRGLTDAGALAGLAVGFTGSAVAIGWTVAAGTADGWADVLMGQPAAWTVPLAFLTMVGVSRLTPGRAPGSAGRLLARLHLPDALAVDHG